MRILLLRSLAVFGLVALAPLAAQPTLLFDFEGAGGDTQGWEPTQDADSIATNANASVRTIDSKVINGSGDTIDAFEGTWMLEATPDTPLKAHTFRGAQYTWSTPQDWTDTPILKIAASMQARGMNSEIHEYRIRVITGTGTEADTTEQVYEGLKSEEFDSDPNNTFVNEWEVLTLNLIGVENLDNVTQIEAAGRNFDDGTINSPTTGNPTPGPDGNWGGLIQIDQVTIEPASATDREAQPGLASLSDARPNPATSRTTVDLAVRETQPVSVRIVDVLGRTVRDARTITALAGVSMPLQVDTADLASGTYVLVVTGETFATSRRISVVR